LFDPSIGQESLTKVDIIGVLLGHLVFGVGATFLLDWSWIPLNEKEKSNGRSLEQIKKDFNWD
tara:strand:+ start:5045 stop:5233 length:189 start_codon:yes stop_codon:yes gene_type:complete